MSSNFPAMDYSLTNYQSVLELRLTGLVPNSQGPSTLVSSFIQYVSAPLLTYTGSQCTLGSIFFIADSRFLLVF